MFINALKETSNLTTSTNGATMYSSTFNPLLDFNFKISSYRNGDRDNRFLNITKDWRKVLEDTSISDEIKIKYLFYLRDAREGIGERDTFRIAMLTTLIFGSRNQINLIIKSLKYIPEFGRWDDLFSLHNDDIGFLEECEIESIVRNQWVEDLHNYKQNKPISLLAKWLPSINSHSIQTKTEAKKWCKILNLSEPAYRKSLSMLRAYLNVVERNMSSKEYEKINYSEVPSKAALLYKDAFKRNDTERYIKYLEDLKANKNGVKVNASVTMPYEIVKKYRGCHSEDTLFEEAWKAIPCEDISDTLVIRDGSDSMTWNYIGNTGCEPIDFATSLAIFFAEHSKGEFKDKFITFSSRPQFVDLSDCNSLKEKIRETYKHSDCSNTDLEATFDLILDTAIRHNLTQEDLPKNLLIISDMEFDAATTSYRGVYTLMETIEQKFADHGYKLPRLIFWQITSTNHVVFPQIKGNVALISGFSQNNYKMIMSGKLDLWDCLLEVINSARYEILSKEFSLLN